MPVFCLCAGALLLGVAAGALFSAAETILAVTVEIFLFLQLAVWAGLPAVVRQPEKQKDRSAAGAESDISARAFATLTVTGAVLLTLQVSPRWVEEMILTALWVVALVMLGGASLMAAAFSMRSPEFYDSLRPDIRKLTERKGGEKPSTALAASAAPDSAQRRTLTTWFWRPGAIAVACLLWSVGHAVLAGIFLAGFLAMTAAGVQEKREKQGDTARIDPLSRAISFVVWGPLVVIGWLVMICLAVVFGIPVSIYERIVGKSPRPTEESEREERVRLARIRRAAASYRLREAFRQPDGFVYFMGSAPHQKKHFLGAGGLLAVLGDKVVVRDYRAHVLEARNALNWKAFEQAPEGALLHVNGVSNMRRDLPFIAIVPPRGNVRTFRLSGPYRARTRDRGAALKRAEAEVRAAIEAAFGLGMGETGPC